MPTITQLVDQLGLVKAQVSELQSQESAIKAQLVESGMDAIDGDQYRVTVSHGYRKVLDMKAVKNKLSAQFIRAHTSEVSMVTVRCSARKTS